MRLHRFRLRTLMIAVAVAGVALGLWHRSERLRKIAAYHRSQTYGYALAVSMFRTSGVWEKQVENISCGGEEEAWHHTLKQKYDYYARHPWLPVPPDPPEPK